MKITPVALGAALAGDLGNFITATTPGGIERQEAEGQRQLVSSKITRLPKEMNDYRFRGMATSDVYRLAGIEVVGEHDDLFLNVKIPEGWSLEATDHSMWSKLLDDKGRERGSVFYKAAFYDRSAHFNFTQRFKAVCEPDDAYKSDVSYEERKKIKRVGRVYDCETIVFETLKREPVEAVRGDQSTWLAQDQQEKDIRAEAEYWLTMKGYPDFADPLKYWEL
jgi:hypothetical protein